MASFVCGGAEDTTGGVHRLREMAAKGELLLPASGIWEGSSFGSRCQAMWPCDVMHYVNGAPNGHVQIAEPYGQAA